MIFAPINKSLLVGTNLPFGTRFTTTDSFYHVGDSHRSLKLLVFFFETGVFLFFFFFFFFFFHVDIASAIALYAYPHIRMLLLFSVQLRTCVHPLCLSAFHKFTFHSFAFRFKRNLVNLSDVYLYRRDDKVLFCEHSD